MIGTPFLQAFQFNGSIKGCVKINSQLWNSIYKLIYIQQQRMHLEQKPSENRPLSSIFDKICCYQSEI